jgi:hypothetical protein
MTLHLTLIAFTLIIFSACRSTPSTSGNQDTSHADRSSAIDGLVLKGPISPVQHQGDANVAPLAGAQIIISTAPSGGAGMGAIVARVTSDTTGQFYVKLAAGRYNISPQSFQNSALPRPELPTLINVAANTIVKDTLHYDTGIR